MSFLQKRNFPIKNLKYGYQKRQKEAAASPGSVNYWTC